MKKLILVDGNAIVHRAFHALPPLTRQDGQLTNAVYGFFSMVLKIVSDLNPDHLIVAFDRAAPTFRQQMFVGYQATRPKMKDELSYQFTIIHQILQRAKVEVVEVDGFEADDLIGTLSRVASEDEDMQVIIVSGDRDLLQLIRKNVLVLAPIVGVTKMILFDEEKVREKYGLEPNQIVDYKSLVGDPSDNYPGVGGIGPKTASDLLSKYETLEGIYENLGEINPKLVEKLSVDAEQAAMAKKLATIEVGSPIQLNLRESELRKMDRKELYQSFVELGFSSLITRFKLDKEIKIEKVAEAKEDEDQLNLL